MYLNSSNESEDDHPQLSQETLKVLQEFYQEQTNKDVHEVDENWQLSQFWYDEKTAEVLAKEALRVAGSKGKIACVSCPTIYRKLQSLKPEGVSLCLLEFDKRFEAVAGGDYVLYDYNEPITNEDLRNQFDLVLADPPFLSEECLRKTALTIKFLAKDKIILCTGSVMANIAKSCLELTVCRFKPTHAHNLANDFSCYSNYNWDQYFKS